MGVPLVAAWNDLGSKGEQDQGEISLQSIEVLPAGSDGGLTLLEGARWSCARGELAWGGATVAWDFKGLKSFVRGPGDKNLKPSHRQEARGGEKRETLDGGAKHHGMASQSHSLVDGVGQNCLA